MFKSVKENALGMRLNCKGSDDSNWSCAATAALELQSFKPNQGPLENTILPYVFGANGTSTSRALINWNQLIDSNGGYVQDDKIKIDVKIMAKNLKLNNKIELRMVPAYDTIKAYLTIHEASTLIAASSNEFIFSGLQWKVIVIGAGYRAIDKTKFSSMLWCVSKNTPSKWTRDILGSVSFVLEDQQPISKGTKKLLKFSEKKPMKYFPDYILWSDLIDQRKRFVNESGAIVLEIELLEQRRESSNQPNDAQGSAGQSGNTAGNDSFVEPRTELPCAICFESMINRHIVNTECGHMFCNTCITTWIVERPHCPLCDKTLTLQQLRPIYLP